MHHVGALPYSVKMSSAEEAAQCLALPVIKCLSIGPKKVCWPVEYQLSAGRNIQKMSVKLANYHCN